MTAKINERNSVGKSLIAILGSIAAIGIIVITGMIIVGYRHPGEFKELGTWGDFFGGTINPILSFLTLLGVLVTIAYQKIELNLTRKELDRSATALERQLKALDDQSFENTFFKLIELHNSIINSIDLVGGGNRTVGRDCFRVFYNRMKHRYQIEKRNTPTSSHLDLIVGTYDNFWENSQTELGHYFRFLFNIVRYIDHASEGDEFYIKLLRSQLSDHELLLLFYNCVWRKSGKFKNYAEKYALFDNLPIGLLIERDHALLIERSAFGGNPDYPNE